MPAQIFGAEAVVTILNRAFNDISPSNATFKNQVAAAGTTEESFTAFAKTYGAGYAGLTADALSTKLLANIGVTGNSGLQVALKDYITAVGIANVGIVALQLGQLLSNLENATGDQAGFATAAVAWNNEINAAYNYSANPANVTPSEPGSTVTPGTTFTLTSGADVFAPNAADPTKKSTAGNDTFRGDVAANDLSTSDTIDGGAGTDTLNALIDGQAVPVVTKPVLSNIEIVNVTTVGNAATFDLDSSTGVQQLWLKGTSTGVAFTAENVALTTTVGLTGTVVTTSEFKFKGASGSNDTAGLAVNGATVTGASTGAGLKIGGNAAASLAALTKFDASAFKGNLTLDLTTAVAGVTVSTGSGVNAVTLGAGNDVLKFGTTNVSTISKLTTVTGFNATGDKIDLSAFGLAADTTVGSTSVAVAGDIANFFSGTAHAVFNDTTKTLYVDVNKDGNFSAGSDLAIVLSGVAATDLTAADLILS